MITLEMIDSLKTNIEEKINNLNLENITVCDVKLDDKSENEDVHGYIIISGGKNGRGNWVEYLDQMKQIISALDNSWVHNLYIDNLDDVWELQVIIKI